MKKTFTIKKYVNQGFTLKRSANQGFTLIELLLYIGILTIIITAIVPFAWTIIMTGQKSAVQQEVFNNARYVSETLKRQIRAARRVDAANSNFDTSLTNNGTKVTLVMPDNTTRTISIDAGKATLTMNATPYPLNSSGTQVTNLTFSNYSSGSSDNLEFTLSMTGTLGNGSKAYQADTSIKSGVEMRN